MMTALPYHVAVMANEVLDLLAPERGGRFVDATLGGGGHAAALLERGRDVELIGFDRDPDAIAAAEERLGGVAAGRFRLLRAPFSRGFDLAGLEPGSLDGVLLDLGVSSRQIDSADRGFSFRAGTRLDMRMGGGDDPGPSAAEWLSEASESELARVFREFGEVKRAGRMARAIVAARAEGPLETSDDLNRVLGRAPSASDLAPLYQAIRIHVNDELGELERALEQMPELLADGGVVAVLAYHSLEDRVVKRRFREWSAACVCPPGLPVCRCRGRPLGTTLTRSPMRPSVDEIAHNPRARSARLRAWRRDR